MGEKFAFKRTHNVSFNILKHITTIQFLLGWFPVVSYVYITVQTCTCHTLGEGASSNSKSHNLQLL